MLAKHRKKIIAAVVIILVASLCILGITELLDDSFYVRSSPHQGDSVVGEVIDVSAEHSEFNLIENSQIVFTMGLGGLAKEDYEVYVTIEAPDCKINGEKDAYRKDYPDFYDTKYRVEYEAFSSHANARYHEDIIIEFPDDSRAGTIRLQLHIKSERAHVDLTREVEFQYYIEHCRLYLISE